MAKRYKYVLLMMLLIVMSFTGCGDETLDAVANMSEEMTMEMLLEQQLADEAESQGQPLGQVQDQPLEQPRVENLSGPFLVERVVDGDTLVLNINGAQEKVRLIGVNTPESVHPDENKNVPYGKIASAFTKEHLEGNMVYLELDVQERDKYGRILGYVYLGKEMYNEKLVLAGHAEVATYPPNVKYVDKFTKAQEKARNNKAGIWSYFDQEVKEEKIDNADTKNEEKSNSDQTTGEAGDYIGNSNSFKFHKKSCSSVGDMNPENKVSFADREDAIKGGYVPCGRCKP